MAQLELRAENNHSAIDYLQQALEIAKEIDNPLGQANDLGNLGLVFQNKGELDKAAEYHRQALEILKDIGNSLGQAKALGNLGIVFKNKGELDKAGQSPPD